MTEDLNLDKLQEPRTQESDFKNAENLARPAKACEFLLKYVEEKIKVSSFLYKLSKKTKKLSVF